MQQGISEGCGWFMEGCKGYLLRIMLRNLLLSPDSSGIDFWKFRHFNYADTPNQVLFRDGWVLTFVSTLYQSGIYYRKRY